VETIFDFLKNIYLSGLTTINNANMKINSQAKKERLKHFILLSRPTTKKPPCAQRSNDLPGKNNA